MKKIIATVPDTIDPTIIAGLVAIATDFRIEAVGGVTEEPKRKTRNYVSGETGGTLIMKHFSPEAVFTSATAAHWLTAKGYASSSAASWCSRLTKDGYLRSLGDGKWQFIKPHPKNELVEVKP